MSVIAELSSSIGDRSKAANRMVAEKCLSDPALLEEIVAGFSTVNADLISDCAEVLTMIAEKQPELALPYVDQLIVLITAKKTHVRREAMHALSAISAKFPEIIEPVFDFIQKAVRHDKSVIVRDHAVDALGNFAGLGEKQTIIVFYILQDALELWYGKQAGRVLKVFEKIAVSAPMIRPEILEEAKKFLQDKRAVVKKQAAKLLKK